MKLAGLKFLGVILVCMGSSSLVQAAVVEIKHIHDDAHFFLALKQSETAKFSTGDSRYFLIMKRADRICKSLGYKSVSDQITPFILKTYSGDSGNLVVINSEYKPVESSELPNDLSGAKYVAVEYWAGVNRLMPGNPIEAFNGGTLRFSSLNCLTK